MNTRVSVAFSVIALACASGCSGVLDLDGRTLAEAGADVDQPPRIAAVIGFTSIEPVSRQTGVVELRDEGLDVDALQCTGTTCITGGLTP